MKKEIIFVIPSLEAGGAEKSLVNLLNQIDFDEYNLDLFLFSPKGLFLSALPNQINLIEGNEDFKIFGKNLLQSISKFLTKGLIKLAFYRLLFFMVNKLNKNSALAEQSAWKYISKSIKPLQKKYDCAIGYLEKSSIYFVVDKITAERKIGWIHTNYTTSGMDPKFDISYFTKLSSLVTVSKECANALINHFPLIKDKISVIQNIVSPRIIQKLSDIPINDAVFNPNYLNILTIARLSLEKGVDMAIEACNFLVENGLKFRFYIIGYGAERKNLEELINANHLQNYVFLLGLKSNPYPYLKACDIYLQPSRYEGKSIAIDEAKILKKIIVVTNFTTATDQIIHLQNGIITGMNAKDISNSIISMANDKKLQEILLFNLNNEKAGTEEEIYKLYNLINA